MSTLTKQENVPVVLVFTKHAKDSLYVIERTEWDAWIAASSPKEPDQREKGIRCFCLINDVLRDEVTEVDFDQTYTREELDFRDNG